MRSNENRNSLWLGLATFVQELLQTIEKVPISIFTMQVSSLKLAPDQNRTEKSPAAIRDDREQMKTYFSQRDL